MSFRWSPAQARNYIEHYVVTKRPHYDICEALTAWRQMQDYDTECAELMRVAGEARAALIEYCLSRYPEFDPKDGR